MRYLRGTMVAVLIAGVAAVLMIAGCKQATQTGSSGTYVATGRQQQAPVAEVATTDLSGAAGQGKFCVELANPQSDDQGYYVPVRQDAHYSMMGYASGQRPVTQVMVNDVVADVYPADYRPYGSPAGYSSVGFRAPMILSPDTVMIITLIDADGYRETRVFHPDRQRAPARVQALWDGSRNDPYYNVRMANVYTSQGNYREAYPYYHRSTSLMAGFMWGSFFLGVALYDDNRYDDAAWQFRRCSRIRPDFYVAYYETGRCYERSGNYALAISQYGVVLSYQPSFVEAHWSLGESYAQQNDWGRARNQYSLAIQYNPDFAPAHRGLGEVYAHNGQWVNATQSLTMATRLSPRDARAQSDLSASIAHQQRSPKQLRVAMAPLNAPSGYAQTAAQNTRTWQGRSAGGQQHGSGGKQVSPAGVQLQQQGPAAKTSGGGHGQAVTTSGVQQKHGPAAKTSGGGHGQAVTTSGVQQKHGPAAKTSGGGHGQSVKPSGGGHGQSVKPSGGGHTQSAKPSSGGHGQSVKPSGGGHTQSAKPSSGGHKQSAKPSGGGHKQSAKPSGGGHAQAKPSGGGQHADKGHGGGHGG